MNICQDISPCTRLEKPGCLQEKLHIYIRVPKKDICIHNKTLERIRYIEAYPRRKCVYMQGYPLRKYVYRRILEKQMYKWKDTQEGN